MGMSIFGGCYSRAQLVFYHFTFRTCRIVLETDATIIAGRVAMRGADSDIPLSEQVSSGNLFWPEAFVQCQGCLSYHHCRAWIARDHPLGQMLASCSVGGQKLLPGCYSWLLHGTTARIACESLALFALRFHAYFFSMCRPSHKHLQMQRNN